MKPDEGISDAGYDGDPRHLARWRASPVAPPSIAVWEITLRCDLGCGHCGSRAGKARRDELNTAESLDLVRQFAELGLKEITLIGGSFIFAKTGTSSRPRSFDPGCSAASLAARVR